MAGSFRVGVSRLQVTQALAAVAGVDAKRVAQRLMGYTHISGQPTAADYAGLVSAESSGELNQKRPAASPIRFSLRIPSTSASTSSMRCWVRRPTGWSNGSGTAYARNSSSVRARSGCGRAGRNL